MRISLRKEKSLLFASSFPATRELVELILKSKDIWEEMIDKARA